MSLVAMSADSPRSSMFTFESTVHSCHVLRYLDDQRQRDMLCDITVVVEGQSFRAHRAVLASCSEYFTDRISSHTQHETVLSLPQKVTVAGFEPLLKFAYTSKLLFSKDNVLEIHNSASVLGFRDLDKACFDFLLPKFFSNNRGYAPFQMKKCCKAKCKRRLSKADGGINNDNILGNEKEVKPVSDSPSEEEVGWLRNQSVSSETGSNNSTPILPPVAHANGSNDYPLQCPKYRKFQLACGKGACGSGKIHNYPVAVIEDAYPLSCLPCFSSGSCKDETEVEAPAQTFSNPDPQVKGEVVESFKRESCDIEKNTNETRDTVERQGKWHEKGRGIAAVTMGEQLAHIAGVSSSGSAAPLADRLGGVRGARSGPSPVLGERSLGLIFHHCPPEAFSEGCASAGSVGQEEFVMGVKEDENVEDCGEGEGEERVGRGGEMASLESARSHGERETGGGERSNAGREEAERPTNGPGSDVLSSPLLSRDADTGSSASDAGDKPSRSPPLNWLKLHANLDSGPTGCPFLQDLDPRKSLWKGEGEAGRSACGGGGAPQSGKSPCVSSLNSGEDGDTETETEGDSETNTSESARQVQLPFSVDWIVDLSRNEFQQLLKQQSLTGEQLDFVHDMRRRSKNRIAARRCRKRKLDCIYNLECEINKLRTEREKLMAERSHLSQLKSNTWHSVSALCHRVCSEANLQPEQLQVLAKYSSPECPLASCIPQMDSPLAADPGVPHQPEARSSGLRVSEASREALPSAGSEMVTGDGQPSGDGKAL
ncbi:transcription regulator protein BACH1b [Polymixia lowei]